MWYARDPETGENLQEITMFWEQSIYSFDSPEIRQQRNEKLEKEKREFMREYKKVRGVHRVCLCFAIVQKVLFSV